MNLLQKTSAALLFAAAASAHADDLQDRAIAGQTADVVTTAIALSVDGIGEANPLGIVALPLKAGLLYYADGIEDPVERADAHRALSATGWGPAVNNVCVIAVVASGGSGSAACLVAGIVAGIADWQHTAAMRERAAFEVACERERALNPDLVCVYTAQ